MAVLLNGAAVALALMVATPALACGCPTITTQHMPKTGVVGSAFTDTAVVAGLDEAARTAANQASLTFYVYGPGDSACDGEPVFTDTQPGHGNGSYRTTRPFLPSAPGSYQWVAVYRGGGVAMPSNGGGADEVSSECGSEPFTVTKAAPTMTTRPDPASGTVGVTLNDRAVLAGGYNPRGTIVFKLYDPRETLVFTSEAVPVNGAGTYSTPAGYRASAEGTWHWSAVYSGDANNMEVTSPPAAEPVVIIPAAVTNPTPTPTATPTPTPTPTGGVGGAVGTPPRSAATGAVLGEFLAATGSTDWALLIGGLLALFGLLALATGAGLITVRRREE